MDDKVLLIAVYDRSAADCFRTAQTLRGFFAGRGLRAEVREFTSSEAFVFDCKDKYDAGVLYDFAFVGADRMEGAETARHARKIDETLPLFFVGEVSDFALEAFRLLALDFLTKPISWRSVDEAFSRITERRRAARRMPRLANKQ
jgi:FixJ family two-component response regulator